MRPVTSTELDEAMELDPVVAAELADAAEVGDVDRIATARDALRHARYVAIDAAAYDEGTEYDEEEDLWFD